MQSLKLRYWKVPFFPWIFATILGCVIPAAFLSRLFDLYHLFSYADSLVANVIEIFIVGATIGLLQMMVARKSISTLGIWLWISANSLGLLALSFVALMAYLIGKPLGKSLVPFFFSLGHFGLAIVEARGPLLILFVLVIVSFLAVLFVALPTGLIFSKYGNEQLNISNASKQIA